MELSFSSHFEISFETLEGSVAAAKETEEDFQCLSGITAASIVLTTKCLYTSNTISLISFLSKPDERKILKHFLVRLEFSRKMFVSGRKKARYAGFCVFWILRGRSYFTAGRLVPVKNHGTCVSIYVDEYQAETTVVVAAATLPGQTTGPVNTKESPGIFFVFSFRFAPAASTGPACGCRTRARYVDDPETSGDDFATKRGDKQQREEAETSTQVYKAVSSVSLSRLSGNENVRPARILIPRTEPPPGWCGPRATPFFFASPMSPRAVLLFLTPLPTPAALTLPGIIFNNYFH